LQNRRSIAQVGGDNQKIYIWRGFAPPDSAALRCVSLQQAALIS
jgi:hypothetical protein